MEHHAESTHKQAKTLNLIKPKPYTLSPKPYLNPKVRAEGSIMLQLLGRSQRARVWSPK